jgi:hypothetical protein
MTKKKPATIVSHRSAVDGRFITQQQAKAAPRESVRETRPAPKPCGPKGGRK